MFGLEYWMEMKLLAVARKKVIQERIFFHAQMALFVSKPVHFVFRSQTKSLIRGHSNNT